MSPAFSSPKQAAGFGLLLLAVLLLPAAGGKRLLPSREEMYWSVTGEKIDMAKFHDEFFEQKGDIDIALMSSSRIGCALDAPYLERQLDEKTGRKTTVRSYSWTWNGYDALYFIAKDLLEHRKVKMLVFTDLSPATEDIAHYQASYWFRYGDDADALAGLPARSKISFYASAVLGMPRNLAGLLRSNMGAVPQPVAQFGWNHSPEDFSPATNVGPQDVAVYSDAAKADFHFSEKPLPPMQAAFVAKIGALAREYHVKLVIVNIPDYADRGQARVEESAYWPDAFQAPVTMAGIAPAAFFAGLTDAEVAKLYYNPTHFNQNGAQYFTRTVTPALVRIYEEQAQH